MKYQDGVITVTDAKFSRWGCVRLFFGWTFHLQIETATQYTVGRTIHEKTIETFIAPTWWPRKKAQGLVCEPEQPKQDGK